MSTGAQIAWFSQQKKTKNCWSHPRRSPISPCGGLIVCTLAASCVALLPAARRGRCRGHQIFMCGNSSIQHVHFQFPLAQFNFYQAESILSILKLLFCFQSPRFSYSSPFPHLPFPHFSPFISTPIAHPHSISSLTPYNLALPSLYPGFHLQKHGKK